jgi:hypothetical protein
VGLELRAQTDDLTAAYAPPSLMKTQNNAKSFARKRLKAAIK